MRKRNRPPTRTALESVGRKNSKMNMPFCYRYTHPTISLIMRELETRPSTATELATIIKISQSHARCACDWLHAQRLIHVCAWGKVREHERKSGASVIRIWGLGDRADAARPPNRRKRRSVAQAVRIEPTDQTYPLSF